MRAFDDLALCNSRKGSRHVLTLICKFSLDFIFGRTGYTKFRCGITGLLIYLYNIILLNDLLKLNDIKFSILEFTG